MDINAYIESGILELYVAGQLSEKENKEVYDLMLKHPEILQEVLEIEAAIVKLTAAISPRANGHIFGLIKNKLKLGDKEVKVVSIEKSRYDWVTYLGWAAAIIIGAGLLWNLNQNQQLETKISNINIERNYLETQLEDTKSDLVSSKELLNALRDKDIIAVPLGGQGQFENTYAKVYWNKKDNTIYLDAQGLPDAPAGKVYQLWSLKLDPLTPTSLGTIDTFNEDENKIFSIENANESQAFGITLEPEGGSDTPTMEQLYTLGVVSQP
ncbi:anti-sigma factor domain-containing protein [Sediminibacter sp. Hel_I_10]|uniref:anti-sigma factor n=1 Tax=Sediminibacter sp. Hel_I_10 TaxID=1392490 RepID=UPI00047C7898|nr:anti-sigma factor [Sediminibacter sp. Hel_I_10]